MDLVRGEGDDDWVLYTFASPPTLVSVGRGGLSNLKLALDPAKVQFALVRIFLEEEKGAIQTASIGRIKFLLVIWSGPEVGTRAQSTIADGKAEILAFVKSFHVEIFAKSLDDLVESDILDKVKRSSGAYYDSGARGADQTVEAMGSGLAQSDIMKIAKPSKPGRGARSLIKAPNATTPAPSAAVEVKDSNAEARLEKERAAAKKAESERVEAEKAVEKAEAESAEAESAEAERAEAERAEAERAEAERAEAERAEAESAEAESAEAESAEAESAEAESAEAERAEAESAEAESAEAERAEAERERPQEERPQEDATDSTPEESTLPVDDAALPPDWEQHTDDDGNTYYFNTVTQTSSWERPQ